MERITLIALSTGERIVYDGSVEYEKYGIPLFLDPDKTYYMEVSMGPNGSMINFSRVDNTPFAPSDKVELNSSHIVTKWEMNEKSDLYRKFSAIKMEQRAAKTGIIL
jgi:hypothetical protein